jgi:hypothetical protein
VNPTIAAGLIAAGISVVSFGFNAWTTSRTLHSARAANLRDRQAGVYQQVLAFASHQREARHKTTRAFRYTPDVEAGIQAHLDAYKPPDWFELQASVLAFCPDSVVDAFIAAKEADDAVWVAVYAHKEAVELNSADPTMSDPNIAVALGAEVRERNDKAERADARLINLVRDRMLGTRPSDSNRRLIGMAIYEVRSRRSLR